MIGVKARNTHAFLIFESGAMVKSKHTYTPLIVTNTRRASTLTHVGTGTYVHVFHSRGLEGLYDGRIYVLTRHWWGLQ